MGVPLRARVTMMSADRLRGGHTARVTDAHTINPDADTLAYQPVVNSRPQIQNRNTGVEVYTKCTNTEYVIGDDSNLLSSRAG